MGEERLRAQQLQSGKPKSRVLGGAHEGGAPFGAKTGPYLEVGNCAVGQAQYHSHPQFQAFAIPRCEDERFLGCVAHFAAQQLRRVLWRRVHLGRDARQY